MRTKAAERKKCRGTEQMSSGRISERVESNLDGSIPKTSRGTESNQETTALSRSTQTNQGDTLAKPIKFGARSEFVRTLHRRVDGYFINSGRHKRDCPRMYLKTGIILTWFFASYGLLVFVASTWWQAFPLAISLGFAMAAIGFNIQHDGNHKAYSRFSWINKFMALTLDMLGGSSYVWERKHNSIHHTYTNISGHDDDINLGVLGRLAPGQKRYRFHRLQHFYLWVLYGFVAFKWQVFDDFWNVLIGRIGRHRFVRPKGWDLVVFIAGKLCFLAFGIVIPIVLCGVLPFLLFYFVATFVQGVTLSVVFQLAHCVEEAEFPLPESGSDVIESDWAVHQIETTVNFARQNPLIAWYAGGLNYQIEHHLFPRICHVNYPAISKIVEETCDEFGVKYRVHRTLFAGVVSHFFWLRRMGMPETAQDSNKLGFRRSNLHRFL